MKSKKLLRYYMEKKGVSFPQRPLLRAPHPSWLSEGLPAWKRKPLPLVGGIAGKFKANELLSLEKKMKERLSNNYSVKTEEARKEDYVLREFLSLIRMMK